MFLAIFDQSNVEIRPKKMNVTHVYFCQGIQKRGQNFCPQEKIFRKKSDEGVLKTQIFSKTVRSLAMDNQNEQIFLTFT